MNHKNYLRISYIIFFFCTLVFCGNSFGQQTITGTIMVDNLNRNYRLRLPKDHTPNEGIPLVFNFHGYSSNAFEQEFYSGMNVLADKERFAVCYPNGIDAGWNVGWDFGSTADDVKFTDTLLEKLIIDYGFDRSRIYSCGMSNGGFMSYHLACNLSDKIAAVASVTGSMVTEMLDVCNPGRSVPVMEIHGTADNVVFYNGTPDLNAPVEEVMAFWAENNGCSDSILVQPLANTNTTDQSTVEKRTYLDCENNHTVLLYKVIGGGHTWPGATLAIGTTNYDINANEEIWNFFKQYTLPESSGTKEIAQQGSVFPNPAVDVIQIGVDGNVEEMNIFNINGSQIESNFRINDDKNIDISYLPKGMYILQYKVAGVTFYNRFCKM